MALTQAEILALDALSYYIDDPNYVSKGNRPKKLIDIIDKLPHKPDYNLSKTDYDQLTTLVKGDSKLANLEVKSVNPAHDSNANMAFFEDPSDHHQYAIFAGTAGDEWDDDATNAKEAVQPNKIAMQKWFDSLPIKVPPGCTVSGHSDGGNDVMYLTIEDGAKVSDCLSYNGEGFSDAFVQANAADIADAKAKITCINCANDPVDHLENPEGWNISYLTPPVLAPYMTADINLEDNLSYIARCHGISMLFARDTNGNLELSLANSAAGSNPMWLPLTGFSTTFLDQNISMEDLQKLGQMADDFLGTGNIGDGLKLLASEGPTLLVDLFGYTIDVATSAIANFFTSDPDRFGFATRDFTRATEDRLLAIASQVQGDAGSWWDDIGDFFESCVSWPVVKNMIEGTDAYWSALLDSNNISTAQLKQLFDDVYAIDQHYGSELGSYRSEIDKINAELTQVVESLQV